MGPQQCSSKNHVVIDIIHFVCLLVLCNAMSTEPAKLSLNSAHVQCACESFHGLHITCFSQSSPPCAMDGIEWTKDICQRYASCKTCAKGVNRCLTCPPKTYGQWCDKECSCLNDGACSPNGICICQNGFTGKFCENITPQVSQIQSGTQTGKQRSAREAAPSTCPVLPAPSNGDIHTEFNPPKPGDAGKYTCRENYTMMGSRTRHCLPTGMWSGEAPTCEKMCSFPSTTEHVNVKINPNRLGAPLYDTFNNEVLAELEFSCDPGYNLVGPLRLRCASGIWDQDAPFCKQQIQCLDPGMPKNGNRVSTVHSTGNYRIGSQLIYYCNPQYTVIGSQTLTCMPSGNWNASVPVCIPSVISKCTFNCKLPADANGTLFQESDQTLQCASIKDEEIKEERRYIIMTPEN